MSACTFLHCTENAREEEEILVEERSSLQSVAPAVQAYSVRGSADALSLFLFNVGERTLREYLGCAPRQREESYDAC